MTLADIAGWLLLSWETVKKVVQRRLEKDYRRIGYRKVPSIAIDELYQGRVRKYITLVIDMESGRIIWVGQGRGSGALREFWRRFKLSGTRFQAVAMDMSGAYAASVRAHAPHAILTFDRFHVMKLMNERLDELRRELVRQAQDQNAKEAIEGQPTFGMPLPSQRGIGRTLAAARWAQGLGFYARLVCQSQGPAASANSKRWRTPCCAMPKASSAITRPD